MKHFLLAASLLLSGYSALANFSPLEASSGTVVDSTIKSENKIMSIVYKNAGNQKLSLSPTITGPDASAYLITLNRCVNVAKDKNCVLSVTFKGKGKAGLPAPGKAYTATISSPNAQDVSLESRVIANIVTPEVSFVSNPSAIVLPTLTAKSTILSISLTNTGNVSASPELLINPNPSGILMVLNRCVGVKAGASCQVYLSIPKKAQNQVNGLKVRHGGVEKVAVSISSGAVVPPTLPVEDLNVPVGFNLVKDINSSGVSTPDYCLVKYQGNSANPVCAVISSIVMSSDLSIKTQNQSWGSCAVLDATTGEHVSQSHCEAVQDYFQANFGDLVSAEHSPAGNIPLSTTFGKFVVSYKDRALFTSPNGSGGLFLKTSAGTASSTYDVSFNTNPLVLDELYWAAAGGVGDSYYLVSQNEVWELDMKDKAKHLGNFPAFSVKLAAIYNGKIYAFGTDTGTGQSSLVSFNLTTKETLYENAPSIPILPEVFMTYGMVALENGVILAYQTDQSGGSALASITSNTPPLALYEDVLDFFSVSFKSTGKVIDNGVLYGTSDNAIYKTDGSSFTYIPQQSSSRVFINSYPYPQVASDGKLYFSALSNNGTRRQIIKADFQTNDVSVIQTGIFSQTVIAKINNELYFFDSESPTPATLYKINASGLPVGQFVMDFVVAPLYGRDDLISLGNKLVVLDQDGIEIKLVDVSTGEVSSLSNYGIPQDKHLNLREKIVSRYNGDSIKVNDSTLIFSYTRPDIGEELFSFKP